MRFLFLFIFPTLLLAQDAPAYQLTLTDGEIKLDGSPDEAAWKNANLATDFWIQPPIDGEQAAQRTEVKMLYDDKFLYLSAIIYDNNGTVTQTLKRDETDDSDLFVFWVDPIGEQTNGYGFAVTA